MEMPEGWNKLDSDIPEGGQYRRIQEALNLMEEMAEALENLKCSGSEELNPEWIRKYEVLKKFKEWK